VENITETKLYLLIKLLKEKRQKLIDKKERHNLYVAIKSYNKLITLGINGLINKTKLEVSKNADK